ncbi:UNVERIFIED_CONTAM: hypothetical protein Slati_0884400 [Sesamum latifolium]|uniref:Reverse transcriptase zinc-binding domain-containing protein n=1 Tax=Sesamum latifolium TaxID=2727402 RepID=A0AAW2XN27_9LAMI
MTITEVLPTISAGEDSVIWKKGHFTTSSAYQFFNHSSEKVHWFSLFQGPFKIPRNQFILWLAILDKLSTGDKLHISPSSCCLCRSDTLETRSHLFFECAFSKQCLHILKKRIKFYWPFTQWNRGLQWGVARFRGKHLISAAFRATLASLVYHIWRERNSHRFNNISSSPQAVSHLVQDQSFPPSYDPFIINYNMNGFGKTIRELINMLVQYEETTHKSAPAVLVGEASTSKAKGERAGHCKRKKGKVKAVAATVSAEGALAAPKGKSKGKVGGSQWSKANDVCMHCQGKVHWKRECPQLLSNPGMFVIEVNMITNAASWLLDTGCGAHICNNLFFQCDYSRACLRVLKAKVRFEVPLIGWQRIIIWAARHWRGRHLWSASSRALSASLVYHLWMERNRRRFGLESSNLERTPTLCLEQIRMILLGAELRLNVSTSVLFRIWQIPWHTP